MSCFTFRQMRTSLEASVSNQRSSTHTPSCLAGSFPLRCGAPQSRSFFNGSENSFSLSIAPQNGSTVFMMRHGRKIPRLSRPADQRKALLRSLTTEVLKHGAIQTTETKAKAVRKHVDKMITLAKRGDLHARRQALAFVYDKDVVARLFDQVNDRYGERQGGYCRIKREAYSRKFDRVMPIRARRGDHAPMVAIELV